METLNLEATKYTPEITLDSKGVMEMRGKSYPENTFDFYAPVMQWLKDYFAGSPADESVFNMEIIYFNSSSSKLFYDLFDMLEEETENGRKITVNWEYDPENENALEAGEDFQEDFETLTFNLIEKVG